MTIKIGVASDLHLEMCPGLYPASGLPECELLLLWGDVGVGAAAGVILAHRGPFLYAWLGFVAGGAMACGAQP